MDTIIDLITEIFGEAPPGFSFLYYILAFLLVIFVFHIIEHLFEILFHKFFN